MLKAQKQKNIFKRKSLQHGYTLIELMVVVSLITLLSTVILTSVVRARLAARDVKRKSDLKQIRSAIELYILDSGGYNFGDNAGTLIGCYSRVKSNFYGWSGCGGAIPLPPPCSTGAPSSNLKLYLGEHVCSIVDPGGNDYVYTLDSSREFHLGTKFELNDNQLTPFTYNSGANTLNGWYEFK